MLEKTEYLICSGRELLQQAALFAILSIRDLLRQNGNSVIVEVEYCYKGGDTDGKPRIDKTTHLQEAYEFGKHIYDEITW